MLLGLKAKLERLAIYIVYFVESILQRNPFIQPDSNSAKDDLLREVHIWTNITTLQKAKFWEDGRVTDFREASIALQLEWNSNGFQR